MPTETYSLIWAYFQKENKNDEHAFCKPCYGTEDVKKKKVFISCAKGSTIALNKHLKLVHHDTISCLVNRNRKE